MKCEIIKDLFPNYIDGLTSKESNEAIEEHLETCEGCTEVLKLMKEEIPKVDVKDNEKDIKPFKKLNKIITRGVVVTTSIILLLVVIGIYVCGYGWVASSEEVTVTTSYDDTTVYVYFKMNNGMGMKVVTDPDATGRGFILRKVVAIQSGEFCYATSYIDDNGSVMYEHELPTFSVKYADGEVVYDFGEIAEELGALDSRKIKR